MLEVIGVLDTRERAMVLRNSLMSWDDIKKVPGYAHFIYAGGYFEWDGASQTIKVIGQDGVLHSYTGIIDGTADVERIEGSRFAEQRARRSKDLCRHGD